METIKWGILGVNRIARRIASALKLFPNAELVAAAARTQSSREAFAADFGISVTFSSCDELARRDVDIIYISTPHGLHYEHAKTCLLNNKNVLCEKPFTVNARQAEELFLLAKERGLFIMEAMWTRFLPSVQRMKELVSLGEIGSVLLVKTENCFVCGGGPESRYLSPALAGGALLDVGIYALTIPDVIIDKAPQNIISTAVMGDTGVDMRNCVTLTYPPCGAEPPAMAVAVTAFDMKGENINYIYGTKGRITFLKSASPSSFTMLSYATGKEETYTFEYEAAGYEYMLRDVMNCLSSGKKESPVMPYEKTLSMMRLMDCIRSQWGLKYPME